jgi:pyruvate kinase
LRLPSITEKDKEDLKFALEQDVEYIALSFVRKAKDVRLAKNAIEWAGKDTHVIAKLEKPQAIEQLDEIMDVADGVMIARGDLGVELSPWKVPIVQKQVIEQAARMRKPVVTATQMLESMIYNPTPTRAEASDVANAVFDGSDALMLSGETAVGKYPAESVAMMARIIEAAEAHSAEARLSLPHLPGVDGDLSAEVARSAARLAQELDAKYIVVYTESGYTARLVSKHRPKASILGLSRHAPVCQRMKLLWGVRAREIGQVKDLDDLVAETERMMLKLGWVGPGDLICLVAGTPFQVAGKTDVIKLHRIGECAH